MSHICNDCQGECQVCESMKNHPAGNLRKQAQQSPASLGWALYTAKRLGAEAEQERIIKLLEGELWVLPDGMRAGGTTYLPIEQAIALIKGENK